MNKNSKCGLAQWSLVLLAVQNVAAGLLVEVSRSRPEHKRYSPASVVFVGEIIKFVLSVLTIFASEECWSDIYRTLHGIKWQQSIKLAVPALIYTVQNNLIFLSLSNIPSPTFQVFSQLKVLTTACFSVIILRRHLHRVQWLALVVLVCGVSLAQLSRLSQPQTAPISEASEPELSRVAAVAAAHNAVKSPLVGVGAVCLLTVLSGFAGVYQEKIVKASLTYPIAYLNLQLCGYSIATNLVSMLIQDSHLVVSGRLLAGYTYLTWAVVFVQSVGGILVSVVIRYSSNLAKSYVVSVAIFASGIISYLFLDFEINALFLIGAVLVTCSVLLYNEPDSWIRDPYKHEHSVV